MVRLETPCSARTGSFRYDMMIPMHDMPLARPFLKWAGGKGQLLNDLVPRVVAAQPFNAYFEPFVGGGALFFSLRGQGLLDGIPVYLSDTNDRLMETYRAVRDDVDTLIDLLREHKDRHGRDYYYAVRAAVPDTLAERAARIIYLNKTCFNGLFRENKRGLFNVPMGRYKNPSICDEANLRAASAALAGAYLDTEPFATVLDRAQSGAFVYFDPPYHPVSETASFTSYSQDGFGEPDQRRLAEVVAALGMGDIKVLLSNSDTPFIRSLYESLPDVTVEIVYATRNVNSRADKRGAISEVLVRNY